MSRIVSNPEKRAIWEETLKEMVDRMSYGRRLFYDSLVEQKVPGNWDHILRQKGMFAFTGLTKAQCEFLRKNHVYLYDDGRVNICDITEKNVKRLAAVMKSALVTK